MTMLPSEVAPAEECPPERASAARGALGYWPGIGLAASVTALAGVISWAISELSLLLAAYAWAPPVMALSLMIGLLAHRYVCTPFFSPGLALCSTTILRTLVALLGLRIALSDLAQLGVELAVEIMLAMAFTIAATIFLARRFSCSPAVGAMMGAANAVCGAAATLATATALSSRICKPESVVLSVVLANAVSTTAMILYPLIGSLLGLSPLQVGVLVGASIQDVAQVVGAGLGLPAEAGNAAIAVKMFRVLMLLPVILTIAWWVGESSTTGRSRLPQVPRFAIGFLAVCGLNSVVLAIPALAETYAPLRAFLVEATGWGLLVAISAVGLQTSFSGLKAQGLRPVGLFLSAALLMLGASLLLAARSAP